MSIIYDALKKVESSSSHDPAAPVIKEKKSPGFKKVYLVYILVLCVGIFIAKLVFDFFIIKSSEKQSLPAKIQTTPPPPAALPIAPTAPIAKSATSVPTEQDFVLNGLFFSKDNGYALVNNRIVKEGDKIAGAQVTKISADEVALKTESGGIIKLIPKAKSQ